MANKRISELPLAASIDGTEKIEIVQGGVSKRTTAQDIADLGGGGGAVTLDSGTYTPTLTNIANITSSTAYSCQYLRVGNVVTVSGRVDITPTAAVGFQMDISLPIASNLANTNELAGVAAGTQTDRLAGIYGETVNNRASFGGTAPSSGSTIGYLFTFTYRVI